MLATQIDTLDQVVEKYRGLYSQDSASGQFVLDTEVAAADTTGLKNALDAIRAEKKTLEGSLKAFDGIDPESVRAQALEAEELREKDLKSQGKIDELLAMQETKMKGQMDTMTQQISELTTQLTRRDLDDAFNGLAMSSHARPESMAYILADAKQAGLQLKDGQPAILDASGNPKLAEDGTVVTQAGWLENHRKARPFLYVESNGAGTPPGKEDGASANSKEVNRDAFNDMDNVARMAFTKSGGQVVE